MKGVAGRITTSDSSTLLREFFREFMELFFPTWAALLDFAAVECRLPPS